jgi:thiol-disulfide isomerase/thioredoxin
LEKGEHVIELNSTTFNELVVGRNSEQFFLVEFYSPICGACKNFAPEYAKIGEYFRGLVPVSRMNIHPEDNKAIATQLSVTAVPHITLFLSSSNPDPIPFDGTARTPLAISKWIMSYLPQVFHLRPAQESISEYLRTEDSEEVFPSRFLLLHDKRIEESDPKSALMIYTSLAQNKQGEAVFAAVEISEIEQDISDQFNISSYPTLIVLKALHGNGERYSYYNEDWKDSLKDFWADIDGEVLDIIESRKPMLSLKGFTFIFLVLCLLGLGFYYFKNTRTLAKNVSELTSVSWGDTKTD